MVHYCALMKGTFCFPSTQRREDRKHHVQTIERQFSHHNFTLQIKNFLQRRNGHSRRQDRRPKRGPLPIKRNEISPLRRRPKSPTTIQISLETHTLLLAQLLKRRKSLNRLLPSWRPRRPHHRFPQEEEGHPRLHHPRQSKDPT